MDEEFTTNRNEAVRAAIKDAIAKGRLGVAPALYGISRKRLRAYAEGNDEVLNESELEWMAIDLRVTDAPGRH